MSDVETLRNAYEAFNRRDVGALEAFFDPEAHWVPAVSLWAAGRAYHGHAGVRDLMADLAREWDRFVAKPESFTEVGDLILVVGQVHAVTKDEGRWISAETAWIWQMRDGKALLLQAYGDPEQARSALGLGA